MTAPVSDVDKDFERVLAEAGEIPTNESVFGQRERAGAEVIDRPFVEKDAGERKKYKGQYKTVLVPNDPPSPLKMALKPLSNAEKFVKDGAKKFGQQFRLRPTPAKATITEPVAGAHFFVGGGVERKPPRKSIFGSLWDSKPRKFAGKVGTTSSQLLLASFYTILCFVHEIAFNFLYEGLYKFGIKTILKDMVTAPFRVFKKRDPSTQLEKDASAALQAQAKTKDYFDAAAKRRMAQLKDPDALKGEEREAVEQSLTRLRAYHDPENDPRFADTPRNNTFGPETAAEADEAKQTGRTSPRATATATDISGDNDRDRRRGNGKQGGRRPGIGLV